MHIEHLRFSAGTDWATVLLGIPDTPRSRPSLLIHLTIAGLQSLSTPPYSTPALLAIEHGHYVAGFDLPNHGDRDNHHGTGLEGMAAAIEVGVAVFEESNLIGRKLIDEWTSRVPEFGTVVVSGVSRGALAAFHLAAADRRVSAIAGFAPVTDLRSLREFADVPASEALDRSNASSLVPDLQSRHLFISINEQDDRVSTAACRDFFARVSGGAAASGSRLRIDAGTDHTVSNDAYSEGSNWLLNQLNCSQS